MEFDVIVHNIKKLIVENDVIILEKFFQYFNKEEILIEDLYDEQIEHLSFVQYASKKNLDLILKILLKNGFDPNLTSCDNGESPLKLAINFKADKTYKVLLEHKQTELVFKNENIETNIYIELAKLEEYNSIKSLIKKDIGINLLKQPDNIGNNVIFYLKNPTLVKQIITLDSKVLNTVNMYNDNYILTSSKHKDKEMVQWILNNQKVKLNQLNNEDRNLIHYFLINGWFVLLDKLEIKSNKKELLIFDIYGNDPFSLLMLNADIKTVKKYFKFFFNDDCLKHYIGLLPEWSDNTIEYFYEETKKKINDEMMFNIIVGLLESNRTSICKDLISKYTFKNKSFYELILYTVDKYGENFNK